MEKEVFKSDNWNWDFNVSGPGNMCFSFDGKTMLRTNGVELGVLKEIHGIEKICRTHFSDKTGWSWVETETFHPFGSEPVIKRKWEQAENHVRVVSDIIIRGPLSLDHITVDTLELPGQWKKVKVISQAAKDSSELKIEEFDLSHFSGKGKTFENVPLVLLFINENGDELEIGTGYDLWRWHGFAARFRGKTEFALRGTSEGLSLERKVLVFDEDNEIGRNNFRFSWYFAWGRGKNDKAKVFDKRNTLAVVEGKLFSDKKTNEHAYSFDNSTWPKTALCNGVSAPFPCFCSRQTTNLLKPWLRSLHNEIKGQKKEICLYVVGPHVCFNTSHINGVKTKTSVHWDYAYILGFWEWANKYFADSDIKFHVLSEGDSPFANLPSFKGMAILYHDLRS